MNELLTKPHPLALDEFDKAKGSLVNLAAATDGRIFSILIGSTAKSEWGGDYPTECFLPPVERCRMNDPMAFNNPITVPRVTLLAGFLRTVQRTEYGKWFNASIRVLWPDLWEQYCRLVEWPVDISRMILKLHGNW